MTAVNTTRALIELPRRVSILLLALLISSPTTIIAQSTEHDTESQANGQRPLQLHEAMQASNESYAQSVVIPALRRFFSSTMFLEGASSAFESTPDVNTLKTFREQLAQTASIRSVISNFDFGPIHSLGYAAAMDTRLDEGGLIELVANDTPDQSLLMAGVSKPWLQGFEALHFLLDGNQGSKQPEDYTESERLYLNLLASDLRQTARSLLESWSSGIEEYSAFYTVLSTAGESSNPFYMTVHAASEEILRGVINALDGVVSETLPNLINSDSPVDANRLNESLTQIRSILLGATSSYSGRLVELNANMNQIVPADGAGLGHWISHHDSQLGDTIHTQLLQSFANTKQLTEDIENFDPVSVSTELEGVHEQISEVLSVMESQILPLTRAALVTN